MAFTIFPKGGKPKPEGKQRELRAVEGPSTRTLVQAGPGTRTRLESETWVPESGEIEVVEDAFLSPSLENAALMFAHGNASAALAACVMLWKPKKASNPLFGFVCSTS
jgi:hypothetical protein